MKRSTLLFFTILLSLGVGMANSHASATMTTGWDRQQEFNEIVRTFVVNPQGQYLGRIADLVFDSKGHIDFAILARPGTLGMPGKLVAIPFSALSYMDGKKHFILDTSWERLEASPVFSKKDLGDLKWAENTYRYFGLQPYWTEGEQKRGKGAIMGAEEAMSMTSGWNRPYEVTEIIGTYVMNFVGDYLGRIDDLVFDSEGRVSFFVLAHGGFLRIGEKYVAVPFGALSYNREPKHFVLEVSIEGLESAPAFSKRTLGDHEWAGDVYRYFGQQPYWTEGSRDY